MYSVGIDIGASGGISVIDPKGQLVGLFAIPKVKTKTDYPALNLIMVGIAENVGKKNLTVFLEDVHSIFGSSAKSNFSFGHTAGFKLGVTVSLGLRYELVQPKKWQKEVWNTSDMVYKAGKKTKTVDTKATSLLAAKRLFPNESFLATSRSKVPHDGLVDAALIGYYGFLRTNK